MAEKKSASCNCAFRGVDYIVNMALKPGQMLEVEVEEKISTDQWRATFDAAFVEDLTRKTGNYKQFSIFVSMLESAITENSESVCLDLLTYSDLESLRNRKTGSNSKAVPPNNRSSSLGSKRYLILTYTVEFDRIHYPLPLPYVGKPDPRALQNVIRQLKEEIRLLKQQGGRDYKLKEQDKFKRDFERLSQEKEEIEASFIEFRREVQQTKVGSAAKEVRILKDMVRNMEEDLLREQTKNQKAATKRSQEFRKLIDELDEVKASERNLKARVKSLTNELAMYKSRRGTSNTSRGRNSSHLSNGYSSRENSYSKDNSKLSRCSSSHSYSSRRSLDKSRERSLSRDRSRSQDRPLYTRERSLSRDRTVGRDRSSSRDRQRVNTSGGSASTYHGRSLSPGGLNLPRFDPTAFIKDKERKIKEQDLKQKRKGRTSNSFERKPRPSPHRGRSTNINRSRTSSVSSLRSRTSSVESLSDIGLVSDCSNGVILRKTTNLKTGGSVSAWSSPDVSYNSKPPSNRTRVTKSTKVLSSTPDSIRSRSKTKSKDTRTADGNDSDAFDRSIEIGEIDARLNRLQQFMKNLS